MSKRIILKAVFILQLSCFTAISSNGQCPGGYTQSQLNWDYLDFLPTTSPTYYTPFYISGITPYNQNFSMGTRRVNFAIAPTANITLDGENLTNTADAGSFSTPGFDVQFTTTNAANTTITMTFDADVANIKFSLFDLDNNQRVTIAATNTLGVAQLAVLTKANILSGITILLQQATGPGSNYADNDNNGTLNVSIPGPVKTITLTLSNATGSVWLSDIDACVTGSFPNNYRLISRPYTGMPSYILTVMDSTFYILDPATGNTTKLYTDPSANLLNGMAYDPVNRFLYYTYTQTGTASRAVYKYDLNTGLKSTWIADVNAAPLNIPTYTNGVESGAASFYDGYYYIGIEGTKTTNPGANQTGRENTVWKVELDALQNPVRATQVYSTRVDSTIGGTPRFIHDWSDIGVTNNGMLYDFDGAPFNPNYYHFNMMTGQRVDYGAPLGTYNVPRQIAIDWQENVYNMGNIGTSPSDGFIVPYNYDGTVNGVLNRTVTFGGSNLNGNFGDCSEAFRPFCDYGDAPATYDPNPLSPAVHERDTAIHIGATWDNEWSKISSALANSDGADEDGISWIPVFSPGGGNYLAYVNVYNNTGENATLIAWLDFNGNGLFDSGEACQTQPVVVTMPSMQGRFLYWPSTPTSLPNGSFTYLRIRLVKTSALPAMTNSTPTGYYNHGETEDYRIVVDNFPLSVNLLSFNIKIIAADNAELNWKTTNEENFSGFEIQRSQNNLNWTTIGRVNAMGNGLKEEKSYSYNDYNPLKGKSYYRLKLISMDGKFSNSEIRTITIQNGIQQFTISPNPATDNIKLSINSFADASASITVSDINGKIVYARNNSIKKGINNIYLLLGERVSTGSYIVRVAVNNEIFTQQLIISKN